MTLGANSYGTVADVAALCQDWTIGGTFTTATSPTLAEVEGFIDQISGIMNVALAREGFSVPVTQADAVLAIKSIVVELAADRVQATHKAGRFYTERAVERGISPLMQIRKDINDWIQDNAAGLEQLTATREATNVNEIGFRNTNEGGKEISPIFQREAFGNTFDDWDT